MYGKKIILVVMSMLMISSVCSCDNKGKPKTSDKITIYLMVNSLDWLKSQSVYEPLQSDRITAFNKRLKDMGIKEEVVLKYYPNSELDDNAFQKGANTIDEIRKHDKAADIIDFDQKYVSQLESLDSFLQDNSAKDLLKEYPKNVLNLSKVDGHYYELPKILYPFNVPSAQINKRYFEKHQKNIEAAATSPKALLQYFDSSYTPVKDYILLSSGDLPSLIADKYQNINTTPLFIRKSDGKVVNPYEEKYIVEVMKLLADVRYKGFTGKGLSQDQYQNISNKNHFIVNFSKDQTAKILNNNNDDFKNIDLGKEIYAGSGGFAILKSSKHKKEDFNILKIMNTDKKSASILQFGANPQRNKDGKIVDSMHTQIGSFNLLGNNLIIESSENEVDNKATFYKKMEDSSNVDQSQLYPFNFDLKNMESKLDNFNGIMNSSKNMDTNVIANIAGNLGYNNESAAIKPDEFMQEISKVDENLKKAGIQDVINALQKQVDRWKKDENRNS